MVPLLLAETCELMVAAFIPKCAEQPLAGSNACGYRFLSVQPGNLLSKWTGASEKAMIKCFEMAREHSPAVRCLQDNAAPAC